MNRDIFNHVPLFDSKKNKNVGTETNAFIHKISTAITFFIKKTIIKSIRLYQRYAPARIRNQCRFRPSCSEYMILSIHTYGLRNGIRKGIRRIKRCHPPNGGIDYP